MDFIGFLNPQTITTESAVDLRDGMVRLAKTADTVGFDGISAGQHYLSDFNQLQLIPFLSRIAGVVDQADIITGIVLLPFHHPVDLAERIATLDALHDNQTVFGVGAGYRDLEFEAFGIPKADRIPRMMECLELTTALLSEPSVTYDGDYFAVDQVSIPVQPSTALPVWMAANANPAVARAARRSDAWYVNPHATLGELREQKRRHYDPIREERGMDTAVPLIREAFVAETTEKARRIGRDYLAEKYERYVNWGQDEAMEGSDALDHPFDDLAEDRFILGTPAEVCAEIERYDSALNLDAIAFRSHWPGMDYSEVARSFELIGDEVIPNC